MKIKPSRNGKSTLSFIDIGKSCLSRECFTSLCLLMLYAKIKLSRKNYEFTVLIAYAPSHSLNMLTQLSSGTRGHNFDLSLYLGHFYDCTSSEDSGETARMYRLV